MKNALILILLIAVVILFYRQFRPKNFSSANYSPSQIFSDIRNQKYQAISLEDSHITNVNDTNDFAIVVERDSNQLNDLQQNCGAGNVGNFILKPCLIYRQFSPDNKTVPISEFITQWPSEETKKAYPDSFKESAYNTLIYGEYTGELVAITTGVQFKSVLAYDCVIKRQTWETSLETLQTKLVEEEVIGELTCGD